MPGAKKCTSTRLQMEIEARRQADKKVEALENRLDSLQQKLDMLIQLHQNGHSTQNGSNNSALVVNCSSFSVMTFFYAVIVP